MWPWHFSTLAGLFQTFSSCSHERALEEKASAGLHLPLAAWKPHQTNHSTLYFCHSYNYSPVLWIACLKINRMVSIKAWIGIHASPGSFRWPLALLFENLNSEGSRVAAPLLLQPVHCTCSHSALRVHSQSYIMSWSFNSPSTPKIPSASLTECCANTEV